VTKISIAYLDRVQVLLLAYLFEEKLVSDPSSAGLWMKVMAGS
jgi:hypothetical protein